MKTLSAAVDLRTLPLPPTTLEASPRRTASKLAFVTAFPV
jgi:hypothetical protein